MIRGDELENRAVRSPDEPKRRREAPEVIAADRLAEIEQRIKAAHILQPPVGDDPRCQQGFLRGRDAVLGLLEGSA